ncbi:putative amidohydrolase [Thioclava sp. ES.031]|uniref:carbon-nitrogen hydrolase family protein n=1 Tax=Thioclava sp. ES.031 TaxID=1798203 RepID=UPI000C00BEF9|nr:carbon-nitrogen hydrolase family protein [Thioclava sp. ES.031]PFG62093.1 putative amidohydrolase [Thioclava sp. ES.031]
MKIALVQPQPLSSDPAQILPIIETWVNGVASLGADLIVLPELILPGYNRPEDHRAQAQPLGGEWCAAMGDMARKYGCAICYGWAERLGDEVFNAASVFDKSGARVGHYRKIQLFGEMERASFAFGAEPPPVFDLEGTRTGLLICYDIEFPEHARALARSKADLILVPTANPVGYDHVPDLLVRARASENAVTVVYANYTGPDREIVFGGKSIIAGPDGQAVAQAGRGPTTLIADLPKPSDYPGEVISVQFSDLRSFS